MKKLIYLLLASVIFFSCEKDEVQPLAQKEEAVIVKQDTLYKFHTLGNEGIPINFILKIYLASDVSYLSPIKTWDTTFVQLADHNTIGNEQENLIIVNGLPQSGIYRAKTETTVNGSLSSSAGSQDFSYSYIIDEGKVFYTGPGITVN